MAADNIDCLLVGYYEQAFSDVIERARLTAAQNGRYSCLEANAVLIDGEWTTYTGLINRAITKATGQHPRLNPFDLPNLACCYLSSFLQHAGLKTRVVNFVNHERSEFEVLLRERPRVVAISTTFYTDPAPIAELVRFIRKHAALAVIVVGGSHIFNMCSDHSVEARNAIFEMIGADLYVNDAQGELTLRRIVQSLRDQQPLLNIPNIILARTGPHEHPTFAHTKRLPENNDIDAGAMDWRAVDVRLITPATQTRTARSCVFRCSFCTSPERSGNFAMADLHTVENELKCLRDIGVRYLTFIDDTFNFPLPRFKEILRMMIRNDFGFEWFSHFRPSEADDECFRLMKECGCRGVFLGIESGDESMLKRMNKGTTTVEHEYAISKLHEYDITSFASLIIGFPGETSRTIENTIRFMERTAPTFYQAALYYHHPSTPIGREEAKYNVKGNGYSWEHNTMTWQEAGDALRMVYRSVQHSVILPLYGFDFFSLPYWFSKGIDEPMMIRVLTVCREMLLKSLAGAPIKSEVDDDLTNLFRVKLDADKRSSFL